LAVHGRLLRHFETECGNCPILGGTQRKDLSRDGFRARETINVGRINEEEKLAHLFAAGDLFAAPFAEDNLPNVVLEALACGTPVAAFAAGGIPEAVEHEKNGFLAPVGDASDLGRGLAWILSNDERHARLRIGARAIAQSRFDILACADRYKRLIGELAAHPRLS
jgi:glycosyltransferase involved in cell wall biosynthesis